MSEKKRIGFVLSPEFRRMGPHFGALRAWWRYLPRPDFMVSCSTGTIIGAACLPWTEDNFKKVEKIVCGLKSKHIYSVPRSTEFLFSLIAFSSLFPFLELKDASKGKRLLVHGLEAIAALSLEALFIKRFLSRPSVLSNHPLRQLLKKLDFDAILKSEINLEIMATDMCTGQEVVFSNTDEGMDPKRFRYGIVASSRVAGRFPPIIIDGRVLGDAAISNSMPLHRAILNGCDVIFVFLYTPLQESMDISSSWTGDLARAMQISELKIAQLMLENHELRRKTENLPKVHVISVKEQIPIIGIGKFTRKDIEKGIEIGSRAITNNLPEIERLLE